MWRLKWIKVPAHKKRRALNRACVTRWKRAIWGRAIAILPTMTPSWLRVERAMIFFKSVSVSAANPDITIVRQAVRPRVM